jgi:hypothetical protein
MLFKNSRRGIEDLRIMGEVEIVQGQKSKLLCLSYLHKVVDSHTSLTSREVTFW